MIAQRAFTLIELAAVLIIIGLLTGGILLGKSLIQVSETQSVIAERDRLVKGVEAFRDKYQALPGDMYNATKMFGEDAVNCNTADPDGAPGTCNGDGNGYILEPFATRDETFRAWQQLGLSQLIEGNYSGLPSVAPRRFVANQNAPASAKEEGGWLIYHLDKFILDSGGAANYFIGNMGHVLEFSHSTTGQYVLLPVDAYNIDEKIDDGMPGRGKVRSEKPALQPNCATSAVEDTAQYNRTFTRRACNLFFATGF